MESYPITQNEIRDLKQTMGFRINTQVWADFVSKNKNGCSSVELIEFVKKNMNPPYEVKDVDSYLEGILKLFIDFIRHSDKL